MTRPSRKSAEHLVGPPPDAAGLDGLRELEPRLAQQGVALRERADDPVVLLDRGERRAARPPLQ